MGNIRPVDVAGCQFIVRFGPFYIRPDQGEQQGQIGGFCLFYVMGGNWHLSVVVSVLLSVIGGRRYNNPPYRWMRSRLSTLQRHNVSSLCRPDKRQRIRQSPYSKSNPAIPSG